MKGQVYESWHNMPTPAEKAAGLYPSSAGHFHASDHEVRDRTREDFLLIACVGGKGVYRAGEGGRHDIGPGDMLAALPGIPHTYISDPIDGWEIWYIHFEGDLAARFIELAGFSAERPVISPGVQSDALRHLQGICDTLRRAQFGSGIGTAALLFQLLLSIAQSARAQQVEGSGLLAALEGDPDSVDAMAAKVGMSKYHFIREFRRVTGVTPWRYVINRRITRAKALLSNTGLSVKQVSYEVGFEDPNYFSRLFARETGVAATDFRMRMAR